MKLQTLKQISLEQIVEQEFLLTILLGFEGEVYEAYTLLDIEAEHLLTLGQDLIEVLITNLNSEAEFDIVIPKNITGPLYNYLLSLRQKLPRQVYFHNDCY
jgi:hypothetical protein